MSTPYPTDLDRARLEGPRHAHGAMAEPVPPPGSELVETDLAALESNGILSADANVPADEPAAHAALDDSANTGAGLEGVGEDGHYSGQLEGQGVGEVEAIDGPAAAGEVVEEGDDFAAPEQQVMDGDDDRLLAQATAEGQAGDMHPNTVKTAPAVAEPARKRTWKERLGFGGEESDDEPEDELDADPVPKQRVHRGWRLGLFSCLSFEDGAGVKASTCNALSAHR